MMTVGMAFRYSSALLAAYGLCASIAQAEPLLQTKTIAGFAYLIEPATNTVLISKSADERMYPASMTKIMTTYVAFRQIQDGLIRLDDEMLISRKANRMGGSRMFIEEGKRVSVEDILRGIIIQSGNDASVALAEFIGGDEANFAEIMNAMASELGMSGSHFVNASGWPDEDHYTTAKDLGILSERLITDFPKLYEIFAEKTFTFSDITQNNRNRLLGKDGVDGIKTGHTEASGYGMVTSSVQQGRRLILVVNGLDSGAKRVSESYRLLNLGFRSTSSKLLYSTDDVVTTLPLWYGSQNTLAVTPKEEVLLTAKTSVLNDLIHTVTYNEPLYAPIEKGTKIGQIHLHTKDEVLRSIDLIAAESVTKKGYFDRFGSNINFLLWGETP